jgi:hypothetical protein
MRHREGLADLAAPYTSAGTAGPPTQRDLPVKIKWQNLPNVKIAWQSIKIACQRSTAHPWIAA